MISRTATLLGFFDNSTQEFREMIGVAEKIRMDNNNYDSIKQTESGMKYISELSRLGILTKGDNDNIIFNYGSFNGNKDINVLDIYINITRKIYKF